MDDMLLMEVLEGKEDVVYDVAVMNYNISYHKEPAHAQTVSLRRLNSMSLSKGTPSMNSIDIIRYLIQDPQ